MAFLAIAFSILAAVSAPAQVRNAAPDQQTTAEAPDTETPAGTNEARQNGLQKRGVQREAIVTFGRDVELKAGDSARVVVVIGGSAKIHGKVHDAVVAIGGDVDVDGEVDHEVVAIMGNVTAGQGAKIRRDAVAVGGRIDVAEGAILQGKPVELDFGGIGVGLRNWFLHCALKLRPLAPQVGFVWVIAGVFFLLYLLVALVLPRPVEVCVAQLTQRPATTFFLGLLTKLLVPLVLGILAVTGIGLVVAPFILAAVLFGVIVGKVALLEFIGFGLGRRFGAGPLQNALVAFLVGAIIITLLYMVPILGLITFGVFSLWGLGAAVTATFSTLRREMPQKSAAASATPPMSTLATAQAPATAGDPQPSSPQTQQSTAAMPTMPPAILPETLSYPRANFWERMGAAFLDVVLVTILAGVVHRSHFWGLLIPLAYFTGFWAWKGTTIGGIVLGLKVSRLDGQPVTFAVALVRALTAAFSVVVFFLGFLWIIWDNDKQGWHDKVAGTVVLRLPRGTPLVCF